MPQGFQRSYAEEFTVHNSVHAEEFTVHNFLHAEEFTVHAEYVITYRMKTSKDLEVSKSNSLVRAGYRLSAIEQQMIIYAIAHARESQSGLAPDRPVVISARDFADTFGVAHANVYRQLSEAL